jgi:glutamate transport system substrate-binding protein
LPSPPRLLALGLALLLCLAATSGCVRVTPQSMSGDFGVAANVRLDNSPTFQKMKQRGQIIIGIKFDQPYVGYRNPQTGAFSGFDVEIATLIAAKLGFSPQQIKFVQVTTPTRETELETGSVDLIVASYSITAKRETEVSFAGPYLRTGASLLVAANSPIANLGDLSTKDTVCSAEQSTTPQELQTAYKVHPKLTSLYSECVNLLLQGGVTAVATDQTILAGYAEANPGKLRYLSQVFSNELYGVGLPHGDVALQQDIDHILQQAEQDGTWQAIYNATLARTGLKLTPPPIDFSGAGS